MLLAVGGCTNRGNRNKVSDDNGRGFLRYILKQKWVVKMNRDPRSWQPSLSTRVCTDRFFLNDLERYHARTNPETRTLIRFKVNSVLNTDRSTENTLDLLMIGGEGGQPDFFRFMPIFPITPGIPKIGIGKIGKN